MYQLASCNISGWKKESNIYVPAVIDCHCPGCGRYLSFANLKWNNAPQNTRIAVCRCPACRKPSTFFLTEHIGKAGALGDGEELFISKRPPTREPLTEILNSSELSEPLQRAYMSAVNVYNSQEWAATAVLTRRLLEGLTKSLAPEHQALPLAKQVEKLADTKDMSKPITLIADAIRKGGNLGAHFDLESEPTPQVAKLMLELAEELMEYFYVLPARIQELHDEIESLSSSDA